MVKTILWDDAFELYLREEFDLVMPFSSPYGEDFISYLGLRGLEVLPPSLEVVENDTGE